MQTNRSVHKQEGIEIQECNMFYVYIHTSPSGKVYVGASKRPTERWLNGNGYKDNQKFYEDIKKYGWDNFKHEIIGTYSNENEAYAVEKIYIIMLNAENPEYGYNTTKHKEQYVRKFDKRRDFENGEDENYLYTLYGKCYNPFLIADYPISEAIKIIDEWIFSERNRNIAKRRFIDDLSYEELGKEFKISPRRISTIMSNVTEIIEKHL